MLLLIGIKAVSDVGGQKAGLDLHVELAFALVGYPIDLHFLIGLVVLLAYVILEAGVVSLVFEFEYVDVEDVIPEEVAVSGVVGEVGSLLLECLPADVANVAEVLLVVGSGLALFSETGKGVEHKSAHDVAEHGVEEGDVDDIVDEADYLELLHCLADSPRNVELAYAVQHSVAH